MFRLHLLFGLVILGLLSSTGCRDGWPFKPTPVSSQPSAEAMKQYRQGVALYEQKQYDAAAERFDAIRQRTTDKHFALMALYGQACSRLMAADTPQEYSDALALWDRWIKHSPDANDCEDAALLDPLIKNKMIFSNLPLTPENAPDEMQSGASVPQWLLFKSKEEQDRLRGELEAAQQTLEKRHKRIQGLEKEIEALKGQIKALETIDQKIQKKKNAIPSTDSAPSGEKK
jgi:TolA-binding protein